MNFRKANREDLSEIVRLLYEDDLGKEREKYAPDKEVDLCYKKAFEEIDSDPNQFLMVVEMDGKIVALCHLTLMPSLTFQGSRRMNVEDVRVDQRMRGRKIGQWMMKQVIEQAKATGCRKLQLTTTKTRSGARRFYEKLGFSCTHDGMKLDL